MNIFILDEDVKLAAQYHCDKHVVKMILETAQILSTALRENGYDGDDIYRATHKNHPCVKWATESRENFLWLCKLGLELAYEYEFRYEKWHKSARVISQCIRYNTLIPEGKQTPFPQAMPDKYKSENVVQAYRDYYIGEKKDFATWKKRDKPFWFNVD